MNSSGGIAVGAALFAASAAYAYSRFAESRVDRRTSQKIHDGKVLIRLLEGERKGMIRAASINTITFYSGKISKESIQTKVTAIVAANPWLLARLVNSNDLGDICALFPAKFDPLSDSHDCFQYLVDSSISATVPYEELLRKLSKALVPMGTNCLDKNIGQFKVTLIEIKPDQEYALVVSLSHSIGDGHTFYTLYSMLDTKTEVKSLTYERRHEFNDVLDDTCGKAFHDWLTTPFLIMGVLRTLCMAKPRVTAFTIDKSAVESVKKSHSDSLKKGQFLSTNDVLTSWFCRLCRAKYGMMAFNYRNKYPHYHDNMAGNYEGIIFYTEKEFTSPLGIRESLTTFNKGVRLPTALETIDFNITVVTNWSSFYSDVHLVGGAVQTMHFPLMNTADCIFRDTCVVFNTSKDTLGVMMFTRTNINVESLLKSNETVASVLKEKII